MTLWEIDPPAANVAVTVALSLTFISLILRLIARYRQKSGFGMDDYSAVLAWFVFLGVNVATIYEMQVAEFQAAWLKSSVDNTPLDSEEIRGIENQDKGYFAGVLCMIVALGSGRLSAVFFYRRVFCNVKQDVFDVLTKIMIGILFMWTVGFFLLTLLSCGTDIYAALSSQGASVAGCIRNSNQTSYAVSSFILDLVLLILPLPKIWILQATLARKIAIFAVFFVAFFSLAASGLRAIYVFILQSYLIGTDTINYINYDTYFLQLLETGLCLAAINMPSIWYFSRLFKIERLRHIFSKVRFYRFTDNQQSTSESNAESLKNRSIESSNNRSIQTTSPYLELEISHRLSWDVEANISQLSAIHYPRGL